MACESLFRENGWSVYFCVDKEGNIRKRFWIVKPRKPKGGKIGRPRLENPKTRKEICADWYKNANKEVILSKQRKYRKTDRGNKVNKTSIHKRRGLGFIPLNEKFPDSEAHHINKTHVIYIPRGLHHTIYHNIWSGVGINNMNLHAFGFLLWKQLLSSDYAVPT